MLKTPSAAADQVNRRAVAGHPCREPRKHETSRKMGLTVTTFSVRSSVIGMAMYEKCIQHVAFLSN